jgi:hypothetical protein
MAAKVQISRIRGYDAKKSQALPEKHPLETTYYSSSWEKRSNYVQL